MISLNCKHIGRANSGNHFITTLEIHTIDQSTYSFMWQVLIFDAFLLLPIYPRLKTKHGRKYVN